MTAGGRGVVYLLHLDLPYKHAKHYTGWTTDLDARLAEHAAGRGARLLEVVRAAGISWTLARTWPGGRSRERELKNRHEAPRLCPICTGHPRPAQARDVGLQFPAQVREDPAGLAKPARPAAFERGAEQARRSVRQQIDAGFSADRIAEVQGRIFAAVIPERASAEGREVARGYREAAEVLIAAHREASTPRPAAAAMEVTPPQEGTEMSTGTTAPGREDPGKSGAMTAQQIITAQAAAGMSADRIAEHHQEVSASLLSGADTGDGQAFAREYDTAGESLLADLREMERGPEPDHTPGTPHPDARLAGRGWRNCEHGIYHRRPAQAQADSDPEAA